MTKPMLFCTILGNSCLQLTPVSWGEKVKTGSRLMAGYHKNRSRVLMPRAQVSIYGVGLTKPSLEKPIKGGWQRLGQHNKFSTKCLWLLDQQSIKSHNNRFFKRTTLGLDPIQTCLETFSGFPSRTTMKAYTKLTVVMCCQIFGQRSPAPSSGNFHWRPPPLLACGQSLRQLEKGSPSEESDLFIYFINKKNKKSIFFVSFIILDHNCLLTFFTPFVCT